jgi:hypothetical protein
MADARTCEAIVLHAKSTERSTGARPDETTVLAYLHERLQELETFTYLC